MKKKGIKFEYDTHYTYIYRQSSTLDLDSAVAHELMNYNKL
jgi:hypothetical protein